MAIFAMLVIGVAIFLMFMYLSKTNNRDRPRFLLSTTLNTTLAMVIFGIV
jgi:hypothetical protein